MNYLGACQWDKTMIKKPNKWLETPNLSNLVNTLVDWKEKDLQSEQADKDIKAEKEMADEVEGFNNVGWSKEKNHD